MSGRLPFGRRNGRSWMLGTRLLGVGALASMLGAGAVGCEHGAGQKSAQLGVEPPAGLSAASASAEPRRAADAGTARQSSAPETLHETRADPSRDAGLPAPPARAARVLDGGAGGRDATAAPGGVFGPVIVDGLVDVAPAGPLTATEHGVALVNRDNQLFVAPLDASPASARARPTPLHPLPEAAGPFALTHGPAVRGHFGYWVSRGRLLRQPLHGATPDHPADVLAEDARAGTRVAVPPRDARVPELAAYVTRPAQADVPPTANLWVAGRAAPLPLTDEGLSAHSVALASTPHGLVAVFLEARTGMSSIHLRTVDFPKPGEVALGEDRVAWVGGPTRSSTELGIASSDGRSLRALLTLERDITHFGLADLQLPVAAAPAREPDWLLYENGIEPAPFAALTLCGRPVVVLARPSSAVPHAPQELVLIDLDQPTTEALLLARAPSFFDVSLAAVGPAGDGAALLAYVASQRTWARTLRCVRH